MLYKATLKKTDEGYSVSCPALPGCWSQGKNEQEALNNIKSAMGDSLNEQDIREVEVTA